MPSPRDLDPKFRDENPDAKNDDENGKDVPASADNQGKTPENDPANPGPSHPVSEGLAETRHTTAPDPDELNGDSNIVYRERVNNPDGSVGEKVHGPMPRREWDKYAKENGL